MKTVLAAVLLSAGLLLALWVNACDPGTARVVPRAPASADSDMDGIRQEGERLDGVREGVLRFGEERRSAEGGGGRRTLLMRAISQSAIAAARRNRKGRDGLRPGNSVVPRKGDPAPATPRIFISATMPASARAAHVPGKF